MNKKIGFIGLGTMGKRMATNLLKAGFSLVVYDIKPELVKELSKLGAKPAKSPTEVAENSDVVITSLPSPSAVMDVILGDKGVLKGIKSGGIIMDTSTTDPMTIRYIAKEASKKGVKVIDVPVDGGLIGAEKGTLTLLASGDKKSVEECNDIFNVIGKKTYYLGEIGTGQTIKVIANLLTALNLVVACEGIILAKKAGIDLKTLYRIVRKTSGNSWVFENRVPEILEGKFKSTFRLQLMRKDVSLALKMASELKVPLRLASIVYQLYKEAEVLGFGNQQYTAVIKMLEKTSGTEEAERV